MAERINTSSDSDGTPAPKFVQIAEEIKLMAAADQAMRSQKTWDESVDVKNTETMKRIVTTIGWPTVSKVGKDASQSAWLLVQHADHDPEFQKQCLVTMKQEPESEVNQIDIAYLEDRVCVNMGQKQVYGTQFYEVRDAVGSVVQYEPRPIDDPEGLDERRAKVGLEPHAEYRKHLTQMYYPHLITE